MIGTVHDSREVERLHKKVESLESVNAALNDRLGELSHGLERLLVICADCIMVIRGLTISEANPTAAEALGAHDRAELVGGSYIDFVHPDYREDFVSSYQKSCNEDAIQTLSRTRLIRLDGSVVDIEGHISPIAWKGEQAILLLFRECNVRCRGSDFSRKGEGVWRDLVDLANSAIIRWKPDGEIIFFNDYAQRFFGYSSDEVVGKNVMMLVPASDSLGIDLTTLASDIAKHPDRYVLNVNQNICKSGQKVWVAWTNKALSARHGKVIEILSVGNDVTAQKEFELALQTARDELESQVRERTADLVAANEGLEREIAEKTRLQEILRKRTTELERSNEDLERFAYVASHELQEPLRNAANCVRLLRKLSPWRPTDATHDVMSHLGNSTERMQKLVSDLLRFARVQAGSETFRSTNSEQALRDSLDNLHSLVEESGAEISFGPMPTVYADARQLTQVFQNLISNSIKFRGLDAPRVYISAEQKDQEWIFSVKDNGMGVKDQYAERIFDPFTRLPSDTGAAGLGLGLNLARKIVERHGGRIWVESQPGSGSIFSFTIPLKGSR